MNNEGFCECGCGKKTTISNYSNKKLGIVKGKPRRFFKGHGAYKKPDKKIQYTIDDETGCWNWTRPLSKSGYGNIFINKQRIRAHRYMWEQVNGPTPQGKSVCHKCDNAKCVNPDHLFVGTHFENMQDRTNKGRGVNKRGSEHPKSILVEEKVLEIRKMANSKIPYRLIAEQFNVSVATISAISTKRLWRHI